MSNVKKITVDKLFKLKYLTSWLNNPNKSIDILINDEKEFESNTKYRLFNYFLNNPKICSYLNKYLNSLYKFNSKQFTPTEWLKCFAFIVSTMDNKNLWFTKFQNLKRNQFTKLMDSYQHLLNESELNKEEKNNLFLLFEYNIFSTERIESLLHSKESVKSTTPATKIQIEATKKINNKVIDFCNKVIANINNRQQCKYCPGYKKEVLVLESEQYENLDVLVLNLFPSIEEIRTQTFLTEYGELKNQLDEMFKQFNLVYGYSNWIICKPPNQEDTTIKNMYSSCSGMSTLVHDITKAKIKIVIGQEYAKLLGIKSITKKYGSIEEGYFILPHPKETKIKIDPYLSNLSNLFDSTFDANKIQTPQVNEVKIEKLLNNNNELTLFDINIIKDRIVFTLIDKQGNKKYINNNIQYPVFIKNGRFNECNFIDIDMDYIVQLSLIERHLLVQKINDNLKRQILKNNSSQDDEEDSIESFIDDEEMF